MAKNKKYIIRESELKEIIKEMVLMEVYDPSSFNHLYTKNYTGQANPNVGSVLSGAWNLIKGIPNAVIPDKWKEAAATGNSDFAQWILDVLGAQKAGTAGADWVKDWWNSTKVGGTGAGVDTGANADAHQPLNVAAACQWLRTNAKPKPSKYCARYVRMALNRGGLGLPHGMPAPWACYYTKILPANGWVPIDASQAGQPCDVVVIDKCPGHPKGHIAMCLGNGQWASDFMQKTVHGLRVPPPVGTMHFYRYRNRV